MTYRDVGAHVLHISRGISSQTPTSLHNLNCCCIVHLLLLSLSSVVMKAPDFIAWCRFSGSALALAAAARRSRRDVRLARC